MNTLLADVHLSAAFTLPALAAAVAGCLVYWRRLSRASVPRTRRRLRRAGLLVGVVGLMSGVAATSFIDPDLQPVAYLVAWGLVALVLVPAVAIAAADAIVTVRFHQRSLERRALRDAGRIRAAVQASAETPDEDAPDPRVG